MLRDRSRGRVADSGSKGYGDRGRRGVVVCGGMGYAVLLGGRRRSFGKKYKKRGGGG